MSPHAAPPSCRATPRAETADQQSPPVAPADERRRAPPGTTSPVPSPLPGQRTCLCTGKSGHLVNPWPHRAVACSVLLRLVLHHRCHLTHDEQPLAKPLVEVSLQPDILRSCHGTHHLLVGSRDALSSHLLPGSAFLQPSEPR